MIMSEASHLETLSFPNDDGWQSLTSLSYRSGDLGAYLKDIVYEVSRLIQSNWSILTICREDKAEAIAITVSCDF